MFESGTTVCPPLCGCLVRVEVCQVGVLHGHFRPFIKIVAFFYKCDVLCRTSDIAHIGLSLVFASSFSSGGLFAHSRQRRA